MDLSPDGRFQRTTLFATLHRCRSPALHGRPAETTATYASGVRQAAHRRRRASRRAAEGIVAEGRVTVDGEVVTDPARDVDEISGVAVDGRRVAAEPVREVHALNKPAGVATTARDTHGRPTVVQLVRSPLALTRSGASMRMPPPARSCSRTTASWPTGSRTRATGQEGLPGEDPAGAAVAAVAGGAPGGGRARGRGDRPRAGPPARVRRAGTGRPAPAPGARMIEAAGHRVVEARRARPPLGLRGLEPGKSRRAFTKAEVSARGRLLQAPRRSRPAGT